MTEMKAHSDLAVWILEEPHQPSVKIWGLSGTERLRRALRATGIGHEQIHIGSYTAVSTRAARVLLFRSDYAFDERLVRALVDAPVNTVLTGDSQPVAAHVSHDALSSTLPLLSEMAPSSSTASSSSKFHFVTPGELTPAYTAALRKTDPPYVLRLEEANRYNIEARIFSASYKGATDLVTKWVWPAPACTVTRWLAHAGVRPNTVTIVSWLLVFLSFWLFLRGHFAWGLVSAWLMTFLDTVDGKLARVTLTSSPIGHVLDHGLDLLHPPFWYLAWAVGLPEELFFLETVSTESQWGTATFTGLSWLDLSVFVIVAGYVVGRLIEGLFLLFFKIEIHCWQPIDSFFRTITARRNPNMLILTAGVLAGYPDYGFLWVAMWTVCSLVFHLVRLGQAFLYRLQGKMIDEWQKSLSAFS